RTVARHLEPLHQAQSHEVTHMEGVGGRVKADVKDGLALVDHLGDLLLVGDLGNEATGLQFFVTSHVHSPLSQWCSHQYNRFPQWGHLASSMSWRIPQWGQGTCAMVASSSGGSTA